MQKQVIVVVALPFLHTRKEMHPHLIADTVTQNGYELVMVLWQRMEGWMLPSAFSQINH